MSKQKKQASPLRKSLGELAPKLVDLTEDVLFGDIWERPTLSKRDRSLITCAALVAMGKIEQMEFHFPNAIKNGVKLEELVEMITHLAFYVGWPNAMSAVNRAKSLLSLDPAANEAAIKTYMATEWNRKFPDRPTAEDTIRVNWLTPTKAEIDIGNAHEVFGAGEWTCVRDFPPIIGGPYGVPGRSW
jgi:4-carboxymuconolactone decarboxylase